jgi:molybdenum cofactor cytidylyltransferase
MNHVAAGRTGIILLAAGGSQRLGRTKQLLPCPGTGEPLIVRMARIAWGCHLGPVVVVLGAEADACRAALATIPVAAILHPAWAEGMGGSLACGMRRIAAADLDAVLVLLVDQPQITTADLLRLRVQHHEGSKPITASRYAGSLGPPAIFSAGLFSSLAALSGTRGAKALLQDPALVDPFDLPAAGFDLDTPDDVQRWHTLTVPD